MLWLVVGLGNPGPEYEATRHNIGQLVVDQLAKSNSAKWSSHKSRCDIAEFKLGVGIDAASVIVAKSKSYMNESGGPVKALANFYKVEIANIIVLHDALACLKHISLIAEAMLVWPPSVFGLLRRFEQISEALKRIFADCTHSHHDARCRG